MTFTCKECARSWEGSRKRGQRPYWCSDACRKAGKRKQRTEYQRGWRERNREHLRAKARRAYASDPERFRLYQYKMRYGLEPEQYFQILEAQGDSCAICGAFEPRGRGRFHLDHDHKTGEVRGILCHQCNSTLLPGYERLPDELRDSPTLNAYLSVERDPLLGG